MTEPPAEVRAEARRTRRRARELRSESRGLRDASQQQRLRSGELDAYTVAWLHGLGAFFKLEDVDELKEIASPLELVEPAPEDGSYFPRINAGVGRVDGWGE